MAEIRIDSEDRLFKTILESDTYKEFKGKRWHGPDVPEIRVTIADEGRTLAPALRSGASAGETKDQILAYIDLFVIRHSSFVQFS